MRLPFLRLFLALGFATLAAAAPRLRIGVERADHPISFVDATGRPTGRPTAAAADRPTADRRGTRRA